MTFWLAEHPTLPMWRAKTPRVHGKLGEKTDLLTTDVSLAMRFDTQRECQAWINANPYPKFKATEHGWTGG